MSKPKLFILDDATVNLYLAGPDGRTVIGSPVWIGACAEGLTISSRLENVRFGSTGAPYQRIHHTDELHEIRIDRLWVLRQPDLADYKLVRNQRYVLEIRWLDVETDEWYKNTFYGVTSRSFERASNSIMEFMAHQIWDAEYYESASGSEAIAPPNLGDDEGTTDQVLWIHDEPIDATDPVSAYFTAVYRWPEERITISARATGRSGAGTPSTFTLEVNNVLTAYSITLPVGGAPGDAVEGTEVEFAAVLPANQDVRWKCTAGPALADAPYAVAIVMVIRD